MLMPMHTPSPSSSPTDTLPILPLPSRASDVPPSVQAPLPSRASDVPPSVFWQEKKISFLASRSRKIYSLCHVWQVQLVQCGWIIHHIDCAVTFSTYSIINECLALGIAPEQIANKIQVTRAFTPYQILTAVQRVLENPLYQKRAIFVTAVLKQFFDGDVRQDEGLFLFKRLLHVCYQLQNLKVSMMIIDRDHYGSPIFLKMYQSLQKLASHNFYYDEHTKRIQQKRIQ